MLTKQELLFAKLAMLNKMVTKDQFLKAFKISHQSQEKQFLGVIMENEGFLTSEEVQRLMQGIMLITTIRDEKLQEKREEELNLALAAQRDGYVSTSDMSAVLTEFQANAQDPAVNLEDMLVKKELMTKEEIEKLKKGQTAEELPPIFGLTLESNIAPESPAPQVEAEPAQNPEEKTQMIESFEASANLQAESGETAACEQPLEAAASDAPVETAASAESGTGEAAQGEISISSLLQDDSELSKEFANMLGEAGQVEGAGSMDENGEELVELMFASEKPGAPPTRHIVPKYKIGILNFQYAQKLLKTELKRLNDQLKSQNEEIEAAQSLEKALSEMQAQIRKSKMIAAADDKFQETLKDAKKLNAKVVKAMRKSRDRGRQSGMNAEKLDKTLHQGFTAMKRRAVLKKKSNEAAPPAAAPAPVETTETKIESAPGTAPAAQ